MAMVEEYKIGKTTIKIYDDAYINRTQAEIEKSLERIMAIGWKIVRAARSGRERYLVRGYI